MKPGLLEFLIAAQATRAGRVVAYGAAAKGVTLAQLLRGRRRISSLRRRPQPAQAGAYLPGVRHPDPLAGPVAETKPDYLLLLAWNLKDEIAEQMSHVRELGRPLRDADPARSVV